jgi:anti-sigma regulatory factor (Ser/Thr protein kinase)
MTGPGPIASGRFSHDLLLHDGHNELVDGVRAYVDQGLASGGQVIVHGAEGRLATMREALGSRPRLEYALTSDLFPTPMRTLFATQRRLAENPEPVELWAAGSVPPIDDRASRISWTRFESLINEILGPYAFHALCTYDTQTLSGRTIAAGRATHPCLSSSGCRTSSPDYLAPAEFLASPLAGVPGPPGSRPAVTLTLYSARDLKRARHLVARSAMSFSALPVSSIDGFVSALNEVLVNGLDHGGTPVQLALWVEPTRLTCRVLDDGPGIQDALAGFRYPEPSGPKGLWLARQLCEDVYARNLPSALGGGCSVVLTAN